MRRELLQSCARLYAWPSRPFSHRPLRKLPRRKKKAALECNPIYSPTWCMQSRPADRRPAPPMAIPTYRESGFQTALESSIELAEHVDPDARRLFDPKVTPEEKPSLQPCGDRQNQIVG